MTADINILPNFRAWKMSFGSLLCTLNFSLILTGYAFAASLLRSFGYGPEQSQVITTPYRIFAILLSIFCFAYGLLKNKEIPKISAPLVIFFLCMGLGLLRTFSDLFSDSSGYASAESYRVYGFFFSTLFASLSVYTTYRSIHYNISVVIILYMCLFVTILQPLGIGNTTADLLVDTSSARIGGSAAFFAIAYGFIGVLAMILSYYAFFCRSYSVLFKFLMPITFLLGLNALLDSGSRSPLFELFVVFTIYFAGLFRSFFIVIGGILISGGLGFLFRLEITDTITKIAPTLGNRLYSMFEEDGYSGRDILVMDGMEKALNNPILGGSTIDVHNGLTPLCGYHSAIIDAIANYGFIFGSVIVCFIVYLCYICLRMAIIRNAIPNSWVIFVLIAYLTHNIFAGGLFIINPPFAAFIVLGILIYKNSAIFNDDYRMQD